MIYGSINSARTLEQVGSIGRTPSLAQDSNSSIITHMKLILAVVAHLAIAAVFGFGIQMLMQGKPGLLIGGTVVYVIIFAKAGCASH